MKVQMVKITWIKVQLKIRFNSLLNETLVERKWNKKKEERGIAMKHINWELNMLSILENILGSPNKYSQ